MKKVVSNMSCVTWNLLSGTILALNVIASKTAPINARFATLDSRHLSDLGQVSSLGSCTTAHSGGHSGAGGRDWFSHSEK